MTEPVVSSYPGNDLVEWLTQVWDEDEEIALSAAGWDRSGSKRASGRWIRTGISSVDGEDRQSVIHSDSGQVGESVADHVARHDPASVLARIAADRQILALHKPSGGECSICQGEPYIEEYWDGETETHACVRADLPSPCPTVRLLAQPYADREGYRDEWKVS